MGRLSHFDMSALNIKRAISFYENTFGWKFQKWDNDNMEYYMITTGPDDKPGINGGLSPRAKDNYVVNTIDVDDIDTAVKSVLTNGGKILFEKSVIPGVGYYAQFEDPEGNIFGIIENNPVAK